jgi:hypothetical protein
MIQFVNTGEYRTKKIVLKRYVNGVESVGEGFPIHESLLDPFGSELAISEKAFTLMKSHEFEARVSSFKTYLLGKYPFLSANDFLNQASGTDNGLCAPGSSNGSGTIPITNQTEIRIYFDSSGSMGSALAPLLEMRNTILKNALLPFYNNDPTLYEQKVTVTADASERTLKFLNNNGIAITKPILVMVFQDEANPVYHTSTSITTPTTTFQSDISALRNTIGALPINSYRGAVFQVTRSAGEGYQFKNLIQAIQNGTGNYTGGLNLSDKPEISYQYDVLNNETPQYYMDVILLKMRELGYRI